MPTPYEHAENIRAKLIAAEEAHPGSFALMQLHFAMQQGLEEHGESLLGMTQSQLTALGGGTPKSPPPEQL